jgi:hypothetical protein
MDKKMKTTTKRKGRPDQDRRDRHGRYLPTHGARAGVKLPEVSAALSKWREALIADLGGIENISAQQMMIIENAIDIKGILLSMISYIRRKSYVCSKGKLNPILAGNFLTYADSLRRHLCALGLERKMFEDGPQLEKIIAEIKEKRGKGK